MKTFELRKRARQLWDTPHNQRAWVKSVLQLGNKWLLANNVARLSA